MSPQTGIVLYFHCIGQDHVCNIFARVGWLVGVIIMLISVQVELDWDLSIGTVF